VPCRCLLKFMQQCLPNYYFGIFSAAELLPRSRKCTNFLSWVCTVLYIAGLYIKFVQLVIKYLILKRWSFLALCNLIFLIVKAYLSWRGYIDQAIWQTSTSIPSDGHIIWFFVCVFFWMSKVLMTAFYYDSQIGFMISLSKERIVKEISSKIKKNRQH
jgi:hypothetical protein